MSEHAAKIQQYNNEIVISVEKLRNKKQKLAKLIEEDKILKDKLNVEIVTLQQKLEIVKTRLQENYCSRTECEAILQESESKLSEMVQLSGDLQILLKREAEKCLP